MQSRNLEITVFSSGAVLMSLELCGSRLVAPSLGSSIFVWTSLIGVILASLSFGYCWGGRLADRRPEAELLSKLLITASGTVALIVVLEYPLLAALRHLPIDIRLAAILASGLLFSIPAILLGAVSPFAIRLSLNDVPSSGSTVGRLFALSTLGSIFGTFVTGFYLFTWLGSGSLILLLAVVLCLLSVLVFPDKLGSSRLVVMLLLPGLFLSYQAVLNLLSDRGIRSIDTRYQRVLLRDYLSESRPRRALITDPLGTQSSMYLDNPEELVGKYYRYFDVAIRAVPKPKRVLLLGGGAYTYPKHFLKTYPDAIIDVVELDSGLTEIARKHFALPTDPRVNIFHEDARTFLNRSRGTYDVVLLDVYRSGPDIPFYVATQEAFRLLRRVMNEDAVLGINLISGISGEQGMLLRALHRTIQTVFPKVYVLPVRHTRSGTRPQNIVLLAPLQPTQFADAMQKQLLEANLSSPWPKVIPNDMPVLTDDYAPVERYVLPVLRDLNARRIK